MTCPKCWAIAVAGMLSMVTIGVGAMFNSHVTFHRIALAGAAVLVVTLVADRIHARHKS